MSPSRPSKVCVAFRAAKSVVTGYPVRQEFWLADRAGGRAASRPRSGREGAVRDRRLPGRPQHQPGDCLRPLVLLELCEVVHVSGQGDEPWLAEIRDGLPDKLRARYHLFGYLHEETPWAMAAADLAVCRSGASVLGELPAVGLPAVLVPYPYAGGHQRINARYLERNGAAVVLDDDDLDGLLPLVGELLHDEQRLRRRCARPPGVWPGRTPPTGSPASCSNSPECTARERHARWGDPAAGAPDRRRRHPHVRHRADPAPSRPRRIGLGPSPHPAHLAPRAARRHRPRRPRRRQRRRRRTRRLHLRRPRRQPRARGGATPRESRRSSAPRWSPD